MPKSVNKVTLLGNLGKDPEVKFLPSGQAVANFSIATSENFKDKQSGDWQERTEWHNLTAYGKTAEVIRDYVKKGHKIYIEGRLTTRSWEDKETKKKVYRTEVVINDMVMLTGRGDGGEGGGGDYSRNTSSFAGKSSAGSSAPPQDDYAQHTDINDDDIPF